MSLILQQFFQLIKLLNSDTGTNQIAAGIALGVVMGFSPALSLQMAVAIVLMLIFRIQIGAALISSFFFAFPAHLIDPIADQWGQKVLNNPSLTPLFTTLYNMPLVPFTRFNNSIVMGSALVGFVLAPVMFFVSKTMIQKYRVHIVQKFQSTKFWKLVQATSFYKWYAKYEALKG
jgi:uncharacterized protein (TIGR03546 family)